MIMKTRQYFLYMILMSCLFTSCNAQNDDNGKPGVKQNTESIIQEIVQKDTIAFESNYMGEEPPGLIPKLFAPGIISSPNNYEFKITFTPDGKEIYFTRGTGSGKTERLIMFTKLTGSGWTKPAAVSFSKIYMDEYPSISPDAKKMFFQSNRPLPDSWNRKTASHIFNLWCVERNGDGWGEPYPINAEANKGYCINYIDNNGSIYYNNSSFSKIVRASFTNGKFSEPLELNTPVKSTECYFALDYSYVIFSSGSSSYGKLDLYVSFLENDCSWNTPINLGKNINTSESESAPVISPDGKYLFYNSHGEIYWVSVNIIEELRSKE
ncbi:MAG: hypothetical protein A2V66_10650 [Ignavibacteria bacterium RBG_13_36_8]|nr:MAG: hypothetical protein A2V66_10650 [Ignavibacteria bacterium RBG_13_36_8]